jgi:uncharacterized protein (DUF305 family)
MKLKTLRTALVPTALAAAITLVGCSAEGSGSGRGDSSPPPGASSSAVKASEHNDADVIFVQTMIPHHEQAVDMTDMLLGKSGVSPEVEALAKQIKAAQCSRRGRRDGDDPRRRVDDHVHARRFPQRVAALTGR